MPLVRVAAFRGAVRCVRPASGPVGLELTGRSADAGEELLTLAFVGSAPAELPPSLQDATVEQTGESQFRVADGARSWHIAASAVHAHRDVGAGFYRVIPPRRAPLLRRLFLATTLSIAGSRLGLALVRALRR